MQKLLNSILRNGTLLLFVFLFALAFLSISESQSYHRNKLIAFNHAVSAPFLNFRHQLNSYLNLTSKNQYLLQENQYLLTRLITQENKAFLLDSLPFEVIPAQVIHNSIQLNHNYITLNAGEEKGIREEMGIITAKGVVGIVYKSKAKTSGVISLLNKSFQVNAKLKKSHHFGSLSWDGVATNNMLLSDIPLAAKVAVGDTIVTGGMSAVFPAGIELGVVEKVIVPLNDNYYTLHISLFEDLTSLTHVYAVVFPKAEEIKTMINDSNNE